MIARARALFCIASLASYLFPMCAPSFADGAPPIIGQGARFLPVLASHGMVVAQEGTAARVGLDILKRGGNAVDAAVATAFALAVTLPRAGNLGGGGFMLIHLAKAHKTTAIDYREMAPAAMTDRSFLNSRGNADPHLSQDTGLAVGVPGTVAGLYLAFTRYGSGKFPLSDLIAPAIALARNGIGVEDDLADTLAEAPRLKNWPSSKAIFFTKEGRPLPRSSLLKQNDLAATLSAIARGGPEAFYRGEVAENIIKSVQSAGGVMTLDDLANYRALERKPIYGSYRGRTIVSMPPPSSGGVHVIELLNILEGYDLAALGANSANAIHDEAEAMKLAYADRAVYLGDPAFVNVPTNGLTSKAYAAALRRKIDPDRARPASEISVLDPQPYESAETTHFSIVDADGNAVANTYTLNFSYGVGMVAEGTGVLLNNELDDFAAKAGAPNGYGLTGGKANAPGPRKRPLSSMAPTMVFRDGELALVTGSPGGSRIITIVLEILLNTIDFGMNIAEATAAPRIHDQLLPDKLSVERGLNIDTRRLLEAKGYSLDVHDAWGSAESIELSHGLLAGAADTRQRGTLAIGY